MGAVYLVEDTRLTGRRCAIKENVPDPSVSPQILDQLREQFLAEANTLGRLDHPNLPKVSDYFTQGSNQYLVMEYVEGENLESLLEQHIRQHGRPLPEKSVLAWIDQVLDAMEYLHSRQPYAIIHRDIKPSNIVLTPDGKAKLVDFGLVKLLDPTNPGTAWVMKGMGTPEYTPLEQYPTSQAHTDARSDIYALSATLYDLLTGQAPATASQRVIDPTKLIPPREVNPSLSPALNTALLQGLAITPDQRFQSAAKMREALAQAQRSPKTKPATSQRRGGRTPKPFPRLGLGIAGAVLLIVILLATRVSTSRSVLIGAAPGATIRASEASLPATLSPSIVPIAATPTAAPIVAVDRATDAITSTLAPVALAAPTSTAIARSVPSETHTATPTVTPTQTTKAPVRPSSTPTAPADSTPTPRKAPVVPTQAVSSPLSLRAPTAGSAFIGSNAAIVFEWDPVGALAEDEYYVLTLRFPHGAETWQDVQWTKTSSLAIPTYIYENATLPGTLQWNVVVMRQTGTGSNGSKEGVPLSPPSPTLSFSWAPPIDVDDGGAAPPGPTDTPVRPS